MSDLLDEFDRLTTLPPEPGSAELFSGRSLSAGHTRHLARDTLGRPAILFRVATTPQDQRLVGIALENLHVDHGVTCRIGDNEGHLSTGEFSIIRCLSTQRHLHEYFLNTLDGIIRSIPNPVSARDIGAIVTSLVALFQALRRPATRPMMGLWAEMFLICQSAHPGLLVQAWHAEASERYDFTWEDQRLEVKDSSDRSRRHHFSLEQAHPSESLTVLVASLYVERCTQGTSLGDLWNRLRTIASGNLDLILKLERVCIETLGDAWQTALSHCYDSILAAESLSFYDINRIPRVSSSQPLGVDEVRFRADLTLAEAVVPSEYHGTGRLFDAVFCQ